MPDGSDAPTVIIDYLIDGKWFAEALADQGWGPPQPNIDWGWNGVHSPYGTGDRPQQLERAHALIPGAASQFGGDRAGLLFRSQCADEYCGLETVRITEVDGVVSWTDLTKTWFEFFFEGDGNSGSGEWRHEPPSPVVFRFDAKQYREAIDELRRLIQTMEPWPHAEDRWPRLSS